MNRDGSYLQHILDCIQRIEENLAEGRDHYLANHTIQDAVLRNLQVLAESAKRLSEELKATQPQVPWRQIGAFRNVLVHDYLGLDLEAIWNITQEDLPGLKQAVHAMLEILRGRRV